MKQSMQPNLIPSRGLRARFTVGFAVIPNGGTVRGVLSNRGST